MGVGPSTLTTNVGHIVPDTETDTTSAIVRNSHYPDKIIETPFEDEPGVDTCWKVAERAFTKFGDAPVFGTRSINADGTAGPYEWQTYSEAGGEVQLIGSALAARGIANKTVSVFGKNSAAWLKALMGLWHQNNVCVPLYDTLGAESTKFILNDADVTTVFCSAEKIESVISVAQDVGLTLIVQFEPVSDDVRKNAPKGLEILSVEELMSEGSKDLAPAAYTKDDLAYIMYTSGTTGNPKGVKLTHRNVLASVAGLIYHGTTINNDDVYLSYLPLAHIFETCMIMLGLCSGAAVGFYQGNVKLLMEDINELKPTVFAGVPRVYSRIYDKVKQKVENSGWLKKTIFNTAFENQLENVLNGTRNSVWDSLVFNKAKLALGGRIRMMASGAAPLPAYIMDFLRVVFCCDVRQGYGMTENAAAAAVTPFGFMRSGTIGEPVPCCEIRLEDCPELNYTHKDHIPRGELCIRGANVFVGYHNLPEKTAETLVDGWLHTGDIAQLNEDGSLQIIDRKKNIFKLAQGEYIAAEELEGYFKRSPYVSQIFVYGDSFHTTLVAVIVPDKETMVPWLSEKGIEGDFEEAVTDPQVQTFLMSEVVREAKEANLPGFKIPKNIIIENVVNELNQGFSIENDCLTPTFKLRRPQLKARYKAQIDAIYANE